MTVHERTQTPISQNKMSSHTKIPLDPFIRLVTVTHSHIQPVGRG